MVAQPATIVGSLLKNFTAGNLAADFRNRHARRITPPINLTFGAVSVSGNITATQMLGITRYHGRHFGHPTRTRV